MRKVIRYNLGIIPKKLSIDIRLSINDTDNKFKEGLRKNLGNNNDLFMELRLFPLINISIFRGMSVDENGNLQRPEFDSNDNILLTKYYLPIFLNNFETLIEEFKTPELFHFIGDRLEINTDLEKQFSKAFSIGKTIIRMNPVVIVNEDDVNKSYQEGILLKINFDDKNSVLLTLEEILVLDGIMKNINMDQLSLTLYKDYIMNE